MWGITSEDDRVSVSVHHSCSICSIAFINTYKFSYHIQLVLINHSYAPAVPVYKTSVGYFSLHLWRTVKNDLFYELIDKWEESIIYKSSYRDLKKGNGNLSRRIHGGRCRLLIRFPGCFEREEGLKSCQKILHETARLKLNKEWWIRRLSPRFCW